MDSEAYGPPLPPGYKRDTSSESSEDESSNTFDINDSEKKIIGPQCSLDFLKNNSDDSNVCGPTLPPGFVKTSSVDSDSESEETFGPKPLTDGLTHDDTNDIVADVEKRAKNMKRKLDGEYETVVKKIEREEWMTMPNLTSRNQLGAISRCLSGSKHRDSSKKEKKHRHKSSKEEQKLSKELEQFNKTKRSESLLEMHRKSKKKKDDKEAKPERKPFNRDDDMSLRLMNKDQVKSVIDKAKYLDSRFSRGQTKYL